MWPAQRINGRSSRPANPLSCFVPRPPSSPPASLSGSVWLNRRLGAHHHHHCHYHHRITISGRLITPGVLGRIANWHVTQKLSHYFLVFFFLAPRQHMEPSFLGGLASVTQTKRGRSLLARDTVLVPYYLCGPRGHPPRRVLLFIIVVICWAGLDRPYASCRGRSSMLGRLMCIHL